VNAQCCGIYKQIGRRPSRRIRGNIGWLAPVAILTVLPKCPVCFAVYIAMGTGMGLPFAAAKYLRISLLLICIASVLYFGLMQTLGLGTIRRRVSCGWRQFALPAKWERIRRGPLP
jgi:hypothetical protein